MAGQIVAIRSIGFNGVVLQDDHRPESSPYASEIWSLTFQTRGPLRVPRQLLNQCPELVSRAKPGTYLGGAPLWTLDFDDIPLDAGHTLVHFLFTGSYECLRPKGNSPAERDADELATAFRVHAAAKSWKLPGLCHLAEGEIIRLAGELSLPVVIDTLEQANPMAISIPRVAHYLQSRIVASCKNSTRASANAILKEIGTPNTMSKLILKCMVQFASRSSPYHETSSPEVEAYDDPPEECSPVEETVESQLEPEFPASSRYRREATAMLHQVEAEVPAPDDAPPEVAYVGSLGEPQAEPIYSVLVDNEDDLAAKEAAHLSKKERKMMKKKKKKEKAVVSKVSESDDATPPAPSPNPAEPPLSYPQSRVFMPSLGNEETAVPFPKLNG